METLSEVSIISSLKTTFVGQRVLYFSSITSTMDVARQAAIEGATEGTLVVADEQTAGRGRRGRSWLSQQGNLSFSIILYPPLSQLHTLIMIASLAVVRTIEVLTPLHAVIKWPNDVLINQKKVCGILIENALKGNRVQFSIIGIGLNVNNLPHILPHTAVPATSLSVEIGEEIPRLKVLSRLIQDIEQLYLNVMAGYSVADEWKERLEIMGRKVLVETDDTTLTGIVKDIYNDGSLCLRGANGKLTRIVAGDVSLRIAK